MKKTIYQIYNPKSDIVIYENEDRNKVLEMEERYRPLNEDYAKIHKKAGTEPNIVHEIRKVSIEIENIE